MSEIKKKQQRRQQQQQQNKYRKSADERTIEYFCKQLHPSSTNEWITWCIWLKSKWNFIYRYD